MCSALKEQNIHFYYDFRVWCGPAHIMGDERSEEEELEGCEELINNKERRGDIVSAD